MVTSQHGVLVSAKAAFLLACPAVMANPLATAVLGLCVRDGLLNTLIRAAKLLEF